MKLGGQTARPNFISHNIRVLLMAFFKRRKKKKKEKQEAEAAKTALAKAESPAEDGTEPEPSPEAVAADRQADKAETAPVPSPEPSPEEPSPIPGPGKPAPQAEKPVAQKAPGEAPPPDREEPGPVEPEKELEPDMGPESEKEREADDRQEPERRGLFRRLKNRLGKTREKISGSIDRMTFGKQIDEDTLDELEEVLVTADLGVATTMELIDGLRGKVKRKELTDTEALKKALQQSISELLDRASNEPTDRSANNPHVIMVVGVNGVGKTTTIGKLAHQFTKEGRQVLLAAGDTFRAAAAEQLSIWSERTGAPIVKQQHGADPSAVAYDAVDAAINRGRDLLLIDTAGRLQTKVNLMDELRKIHRVVGKRLEGAPHEVLLVLDATTGQNALSQAKLFNEAVKVDGVVLTKLDGTAKGGIVVAIASELKLPIRYVGLGEGIDDLRPFDPEDFAEALF